MRHHLDDFRFEDIIKRFIVKIVGPASTLIRLLNLLFKMLKECSKFGVCSIVNI